MRLFSRLRGSRQSRLRSSTYCLIGRMCPEKGESQESRRSRAPAILSLVFGGNRDKDQNEIFESRPIAMSSEGRQRRSRAAPVAVSFLTILLAGAGQAAAQQGGTVSPF